MSQRTALISGISGQDGSNLTDLLLSKDYVIHGIVRRHSYSQNQTTRLHHCQNRVHFHYGDVTDAACLSRIVREVQPDEVYHLAAQSHVRVSFDNPKYTVEVNGIGTMNMLEAIRLECPKARSYTACSSEQFGESVDADGFQRETTKFCPVSPYGASKVLAYNITHLYRAGYGQFAALGILFNHTGSRRGVSFVEAKIAKTLAEVAAGKAEYVELGNVDSRRDWGSSVDYVRAMWLILQHDKPEDFVIATGETYSVWDFAIALCAEFDLDPQRVIKTGVERYQRPQELPYLRGDASKARRVLGWEPTVTFAELVKELADHWRTEVARSV